MGNILKYQNPSSPLLVANTITDENYAQKVQEMYKLRAEADSLGERYTKADSLGEEIAMYTLRKHMGLTGSALNYGNWAGTIEAGEPEDVDYLIDHNIRIEDNDVVNFLQSYVNSEGFNRIRNNQINWWKTRHPYQKYLYPWALNDEKYINRYKNAINNYGDKMLNYTLDGYPSMSFSLPNRGSSFTYRRRGRDDKEHPYFETQMHELDHLFNIPASSLGTINSEVFDQNTNTKKNGHDEYRDEKHSDNLGVKYLLYKEGIYDVRDNKDITPEQVQQLRNKYPKLRFLQQLNNEDAAFQINHVAQNTTDSNHIGYRDPITFAKKGGRIHIKKKNRGKFTASAKRAGMGVQEYARHVLANKDKYSSTLVKRANFARNAKKFKHEEGGIINKLQPGGEIEYDITPAIITQDSEFNKFLMTLPDNLRLTPEKDYHMYAYWKLSGKPENFREGKRRRMFTWDNSDKSYHAGSIAEDRNTGIYHFMKPKHHPTVKYELDWFNKGLQTLEGGKQVPVEGKDKKFWEDFTSKYQLDTTGVDYQYVPIKKNGGILKAQEGTGNNFWSKLWNAVKEGGMAARDAKLGAIGAQQVRDLYSEGKNQEALDLAKRYAKANTTGVALAGGAASTGLLGDLMVTGATTAADTFIDGDTDNFGKNLSLNAAFDLIGHGAGKLLRNVNWGKVKNNVELIPDSTKADVPVSKSTKVVVEESKPRWANTSQSKLSEAERLGIPKGERSNPKVLDNPQYWGYEQWNKRYNKAVEEWDLDELQRLRDLHFITKAPGTKVITESGMPQRVYHFTSRRKPVQIFTKGSDTYPTPMYFTSNRDGLLTHDPYNITDMHPRHVRGDYYMKMENPLKEVPESAVRDYWGNYEFNELKKILRRDPSMSESIINYYRDRINGLMKQARAAHRSGNQLLKNDLFNKIEDLGVTLRKHVSRDLPTKQSKIYGLLGREGVGFEDLMKSELQADGIIHNVGPTQHYITYDPEVIKSAESVTYNDFDNIIPIVKRDNFRNVDSRYQQGGKL